MDREQYADTLTKHNPQISRELALKAADAFLSDDKSKLAEIQREIITAMKE